MRKNIIRTAEEFLIDAVESERESNKKLIISLAKCAVEKSKLEDLLIGICKNIIIKDSAYFGRYFDFEYQIAEGDNRNPELFNAVLDFMKENGIIEEEQEEKSDG